MYCNILVMFSYSSQESTQKSHLIINPLPSFTVEGPSSLNKNCNFLTGLLITFSYTNKFSDFLLLLLLEVIVIVVLIYDQRVTGEAYNPKTSLRVRGYTKLRIYIYNYIRKKISC